MTAPVIFLDIDGVLNSQRSCAALGGFPYPLSPQNWHLFDPVAVGLLRRVVQKTGAVCVLSSSWRGLLDDLEPLASTIGVPIIDKTRSTVGRERRGDQIRDWLGANPEVAVWAILDDDRDMLDDQKDRFIHVGFRDGLSYQDHLDLILLLGGERQS